MSSEYKNNDFSKEENSYKNEPLLEIIHSKIIIL